MKASRKALQSMELASSSMFDSIGITSSLVDGAIEEVENTENASGASLFRFVMLKATDKGSHKEKVDTDKAKDNANDVVFTFDDVDLGWAMKASSSGSLGALQ